MAGILVVAVGLSWDSGNLKCSHLANDKDKNKTLESHTKLIHAIVFAFLPVLALPFLQLLRLKIVSLSSEFLQQTMKR